MTTRFISLVYSTINETLQGQYEYLLSTWWFRHDSFEPCWASFLFALNIGAFMIIDFYLPQLHKYRIRDRDVDERGKLNREKMKKIGNLQIFKDSTDNSSSFRDSWKGRYSALWQETLWYLAPWLILDSFYKRRHLILVSKAPTLLQLIWDIFYTLLVYDSLFYVGHRSMHSCNALYRFHRKHHSMCGNIVATDAIRHDIVDGTFDVFCSVVALKITRAHVFSRIFYNFIAIFFITEAHSNYVMPWSLSGFLPLLCGPVVHKRHHAKGHVNFGKFFVIFDYVFGTLQW